MLRHYEKGDIYKVKVQDGQKNESLGDESLWISDETMVFEFDGEVLAIVRPFFEYDRITLSAWISKDCGKHSVNIFKKIQRLIQEWLENDETNRVEFITQTDFVQANRLAELLGFTKEGTMRKYYKGMDFNIWGRIK